MLVCEENSDPFEKDERDIRQAELEVANASGHAAQQAARKRLERLRENRFAHSHGCALTYLSDDRWHHNAIILICSDSAA